MKKLMTVGTVVGLLVLSSVAFAQDKKMTEISFEDDRIEGDLMMPTSSNISIKELDELSSLIKAREDFVDEMRKTIDEL
ncbi:MAG: hypothetical protein FWC40_01510 [Proteobacteria bacterium]|nr:hypothetical protein [Pseudomonadota bacterium]